MGKSDERRKQKERAAENARERQRVTLRVYQDVDAVAERTLAALAKSGVHPTCAEGCAYCCRLEIPVTRAEAETIVAWLHEHHTAEELEAIRARLAAWLAWYRGDYAAHVAAGMERADVFFRHGVPCALLEGTRCGAYPVRPIACRNHYVHSSVEDCDPARSDREPETIDAVGVATRDHVLQIRLAIERQGGNWLASVHLLQEWLCHLLEVEREPWKGAPHLFLGV